MSSRKRKLKKTPSEIDTIATLSEKMTAEELNEYISLRFEKNLETFKNLVNEEKDRIEQIREDPSIKYLLQKAKNFYEDLIADGYVKKDFSLFKGETLKFYKLHQARDESVSLLEEIRKINPKYYKTIFRKLNRFYVINYEALFRSYLVELAQKVSGRCISNNSKVLFILSSYKNGKHKELFRSLIPQIRNSIQHQDFIVDPKQPQIIYYDRIKPPLKLDIDGFIELCYELFFLHIVFDITHFDLISGLLDILIEAVDVVNDFIKKHNLKLVRGGALSILDWATLIKSGKIKT